MGSNPQQRERGAAREGEGRVQSPPPSVLPHVELPLLCDEGFGEEKKGRKRDRMRGVAEDRKVERAR